MKCKPFFQWKCEGALVVAIVVTCKHTAKSHCSVRKQESRDWIIQMWWFEVRLREFILQAKCNLESWRNETMHIDMYRIEHTSSKKLIMQLFGFLPSGIKRHWTRWSITVCRTSGIDSIVPKRQ